MLCALLKFDWSHAMLIMKHICRRIAELLEFVAEDLTGRSLYTLCHAEDVRLLRKSHTDCKLYLNCF